MLIGSNLLGSVRRAIAERSLYEYAKQAWPYLEPGTEFIEGHHLKVICDHLEALTHGELSDLLINMPPRFMKSLLVNVCWPTWEWVQFPHLRVLSYSYSQDLSIRDNIKRRLLVQSPWYQSNWGDRFQLLKDSNQKEKFINSKQGFMFASSVTGQGTGEGGDRIIVDDPLNAKEAHSKAARESVKVWWTETMPTRLNNRKTGKRVVVMQRLHEDDLSGIIIAAGGWTHLNLPFRFEGEVCKTSIGYQDTRTIAGDPSADISNPNCPKERGELLWNRYSEEDARKLEKELGPYGVAGQLQQRPTPKGGGIFKRDWFRTYDTLPPLDSFTRIGTSWDTTFKGLQTAKAKDGPDFVCGQVWGEIGADFFLIAQEHGQWEYPEFKAGVVRLSQSKAGSRSSVVLVEDKGNGPAVISELDRTVRGLTPVNPQGGKEARAHAITPTASARNIWIPNPDLPGNEWVRSWLAEVTGFPNAKYDDMVDAMTQYINWAIENGEFIPDGYSH